MAKIQHYIFIDKKKLIKGNPNPGKIIGSMRKLLDEQIVVNNKLVTYDVLISLLGKEKYFNNDDYYIKRTEIERMNRKK